MSNLHQMWPTNLKQCVNMCAERTSWEGMCDYHTCNEAWAQVLHKYIPSFIFQCLQPFCSPVTPWMLIKHVTIMILWRSWLGSFRNKPRAFLYLKTRITDWSWKTELVRFHFQYIVFIFFISKSLFDDKDSGHLWRSNKYHQSLCK